MGRAHGRQSTSRSGGLPPPKGEVEGEVSVGIDPDRWDAGVRGRRHSRPVGPRPALTSQPISNSTHGGFSVMDALPVLSLVILLALLAAWFGHDSREQLASSEETFARQGFFQAWYGERP